MSVQDILNAHNANMASINKAGVDRMIEVGEAQAQIITSQIAIMADPTGELLHKLIPSSKPAEPEPNTDPVV